MKTALLIVDVQNDFCPGGALGVKDGAKLEGGKIIASDLPGIGVTPNRELNFSHN
jgi:nicotinamidase-related amidase